MRLNYTLSNWGCAVLTHSVLLGEAGIGLCAVAPDSPLDAEPAWHVPVFLHQLKQLTRCFLQRGPLVMTHVFVSLQAHAALTPHCLSLFFLRKYVFYSQTGMPLTQWTLFISLEKIAAYIFVLAIFTSAAFTPLTVSLFLSILPSHPRLLHLLLKMTSVPSAVWILLSIATAGLGLGYFCCCDINPSFGRPQTWFC